MIGLSMCPVTVECRGLVEHCPKITLLLYSCIIFLFSDKASSKHWDFNRPLPASGLVGQFLWGNFVLSRVDIWGMQKSATSSVVTNFLDIGSSYKRCLTLWYFVLCLQHPVSYINICPTLLVNTSLQLLLPLVYFKCN